METGNMRYAADKPEKCTDCYFWHKRKGCCEREIGYYLLEQEKRRNQMQCMETAFLPLWETFSLSLRAGSGAIYILPCVEAAFYGAGICEAVNGYQTAVWAFV